MEKMKFRKYLNNSKKWRSLGVAVLAIVLPVQSFASGDGNDCANMECNSLFAPEVIDSKGEEPFFRSYHSLYGGSEDADVRHKSIQTLNTQDWTSRFGWKFTEKSLNYLLYKMSLSDLESLTANLFKGAKNPLGREVADVSKSLISYMSEADSGAEKDKRKNAVLNDLKYLAFAKAVEPFATLNLEANGWESVGNAQPKIPLAERLAQAQKLENSSVALIKLCGGDEFLVQRYRLQVLRIYYYGQLYPEAQAYYKNHVKEFGAFVKPTNQYENESQSVKYRFLDYAAGAFYKSAGAIFTKQKNLEKGEVLTASEMQNMTAGFATANYLYSLIFDQFAPLKNASYLSFHPMEQADWEATLALAKTQNEKLVLWQLLGIYADGKIAIEQIYASNPGSKLLPLLLVREVNKAEESWALNQERIEHPEYGDNEPVTTDAVAVGVARFAALEKIAQSGKVYSPYLWELAVGHLATLAGDYDKAGVYLARAKASAPKGRSVLNAQIRMSKLLRDVRQLVEVTAAVEAKLSVELTWLDSYQNNEANYRAATLDQFISKKLSKLYASKGDVVRSLLLNDKTDSDFYRDNVKVDSMIKLLTAPLSSFDDYLASTSHYTVGQLNEIKALNSLYAGKLTEANQIFAQVGTEIADQELNADPFMIAISDNHDRDFELPHQKYTKVSFAQKMLELSVAAQGMGLAAAEASFKLANGYYNMSYYGNGRDIYDTEFSNLHYRSHDGLLNRELNLNMDLAQKFYQQAYDLAVKNSASKEFLAEAVWMLAKVERNVFENQHGKASFNDELVTKYLDGSSSLKKFKEEFSDTQYYKEVIAECGYFASYMAR